MVLNTKVKGIVIQALLWTGLWLITFINDFEDGLHGEELIIESFLYLMPIILPVYANVLWIIPKYLYTKKYRVYVLLLVLLSAPLPVIESLIYDHLDFYIVLNIIENLLWVGGISSVWIIIDQLKVKEKLIHTEKEQSETRLKYLKSQINPHFLFNVLNNIQFLIQKDKERASKVLFKLSDLLRYQLYETESKEVPLHKEVENIKSYIAIEEIRMGDRLELNTVLEYENQSVNIAPFMLLTLVENAFKHSSGREKSTIELKLRASADRLEFFIENSVISQKKKTNGLGLKNLKQRLELLYPERYSFEHGLRGKNYYANLTIAI